MRINASLVRTGPSPQVSLAAELRTQALAAVRDAAEDGRTRRYLYDGLISRDQAARGAVVGQYVRIAQAEQAAEDDTATGPSATAADDGFLRRDLIDSMFQQMTGALGGVSTGQWVVTHV